MKQPKIALLVDHPRRDLAGLVLTAQALCRRGAACYLVPANLAAREIWAIAPDFVLFNYFRKSNEALAQGCVEAGIQFGLLDTEGGVWPDFASYRELLWRDEWLLAQARAVCAWGSRMAHDLVAEGVFSAERVHITGCPRFDFYHPSWREALLPGHSATPAEGLLINTNFSTVNPRFTTVEKKIATSRRNFGWSEERVQAILETERQAIAATIELARSLAADFPGRPVTLRPHPFEDPETYRRALRDLPAVEVNGDGPVQPQIFRSRVVIQRSCTTGIEAALAGVPTISPLWITPPFLMPVAEAVSLPCATYAELRGLVAAICDGAYGGSAPVRDATDTVIRDWFHSVDGLAHRRVADVVLGSLDRGRTVDRERCAWNLYRYSSAGSTHRGRALLLGRARHTLRLSPDWSFHRMRALPPRTWEGTDKFFGAGEVAALIADLERALAGADGDPGRRLRAAPAAGEMLRGLQGYTVALRPEQ